MNEKSIMPLNSYSAYSPPFHYSAFIDLQLNFSRLCQNRTLKKSSITNKDDMNMNGVSMECPSPELWKINKKSLIPKQYVFGEDDDPPYNKTTMTGKRRRKGLSLIESCMKPNTDVPELVIFKSPTNLLNRYISPLARDIKETPKSVREIPKSRKEKKSKLVFPALVEDEQKKMKEFLFEYFMKSLQISNGINSLQGEMKTYKFYVGPGNNSSLVIKIIRNRT